jgi:hypothetical protein
MPFLNGTSKLAFEYSAIMRVQGLNYGLRIAIIICCVFTAILVYLPAEAKATSPHNFERHSIHPWESTSRTLVVLGLCSASIIAANLSLAPWLEASAYRYDHCAPRTGFNPRSISVLVWAPAGAMRIGGHCAVHPFERFAKFQESFRTLDG